MSTRPTPADDLGLLTIPEVAARLSLHPTSVYDLIHAGSIRPVLIKGKYRVDRRELRRFLDRLAAERDADQATAARAMRRIV